MSDHTVVKLLKSKLPECGKVIHPPCYSFERFVKLNNKKQAVVLAEFIKSHFKNTNGAKNRSPKTKASERQKGTVVKK